MERIHHFRCHLEHSWFMGRGQNINMNRTLEVDSNPHGWLWGIQEFRGGSNAREVVIARDLELEVEPQDVTDCCNHVIKL